MMKRRYFYSVLVVFAATGLVLTAGLMALVARPINADVVQAIAGDPLAAVVDAQTGRTFVAGLSLGAAPGVVSVLDTRTGAPVRTVAVGYAPFALAVAERAGRVFVLNSDATIRILDGATGASLRTIPLRAPPYAVAVDERTARVFVDTADGTLDVLDARTGTLLRAVALDGHPGGLAVDSRRARVIVAVVTAADERVVVLDERGARPPHTTIIGRTPGKAGGAVAVDERSGHAFVTQPNSGRVSIVDTGRGTLLRTSSVASGPYAIAAVARTGRIFVVGANGASVSVLDAGTGRLLRTVGVGPLPVGVGVDPRADRVYVACQGAATNVGLPVGPGSLVVLDARSGAALNSRSVGGVPVAVAVDPATARIVVASRGGMGDASGAATWVPGWLRRWLPFLPAPMRTIPPGVSLLRALR